MNYFEHLKNILSPNYEKFTCFYNYKTQRLDLKFYPIDINDTHLIITYEPGSPYIDDEVDKVNL